MRSSRNIIERERSAQALRESEERLGALFETVQVGVVVFGANAEVLSSNAAARDLLGVTAKQLLGNTAFDPMWNWFHEDGSSCPVAQHPIPRAIASRQPVRSIVLGVDRPMLGDRVWLLADAQPQLASDGSVVRVICRFQDITVRKRTEDELRRSEAYLAAGQRLSHTGSWALNLSSGEIFWSQETFRIFGFEPPVPPERKVIVMEDFLQRIHPEDRPAIEWGIDSASAQNKSHEVDYRIVLPDGSIRYVHDVVYPVTNDSGEVVERFGVVMDVTERKRSEEQLQNLLGQLRLLAARVQRAREEEGTRVAREIHDELGQALTAIKIELSSLVHDLPVHKKRQSKGILELVDGTIQSVRRICTELRPAILDDLGLVAALEWAVGEFAARTGTRCRLELPPDEIVINQECSTALFRIFQETLTNVARHANATEVNVRLAKDDGNLVLEVHDNGKGISEERLSARNSLGILGMRERALLVGGEFTITGGHGEGTTVRVRIPETPPAPPDDK